MYSPKIKINKEVSLFRLRPRLRPQIFFLIIEWLLHQVITGTCTILANFSTLNVSLRSSGTTISAPPSKSTPLFLGSTTGMLGFHHHQSSNTGYGQDLEVSRRTGRPN
ncbi:Transcription factor TCP8 [Abeliophyllum distichum]|uniref:Transcription factor TCP8 n=1 Tax=Abeliophyllum distichum TaxID=126358 RepID=A0ABD1QI01_9LAMI